MESGNDTQYRTYAAAGNMEDDSISCSISFSVSEQYNLAGSGYSDLNGCVDRNSGTIITDDSLNCDVPLDGLASATSVLTLVDNNILTAKTNTGWNNINLSTGSINFSDQNDLYTTAPETH